MMPVSEPTEAILTAAIDELKESIVDEQKATNDLTERIGRLTCWLLVFTVVIGVMTLAQILIALKIIGR